MDVAVRNHMKQLKGRKSGHKWNEESLGKVSQAQLRAPELVHCRKWQFQNTFVCILEAVSFYHDPRAAIDSEIR
ncbi:hypothetical protein XELAEV_18035708mg [Xenopus laevis]|uniref:Uncharacterized protein n=1 Tax=Xenopus laevis TaxID=8355 RepID=A0A974HCC1_XENLA|nr:hypothetical protein XELAEV_18035708mg [Xenopus laevis]